MKGIKKVAGMTQRYCGKDGYGMRVQGIYDPAEDKITGIVQTDSSYLVPKEGKISIWFSMPTTMEQVETAVYNKIAEISAIEKYIQDDIEAIKAWWE